MGKQKVEITLAELFIKEKQLEGDIIILARRFAKTGNKALYTLLSTKEAKFEELKVLRLKTNEESGANKLISEHSILMRKKETLVKTIRNNKKNSFVNFIKESILRKKIFTEEDIIGLLAKIESDINKVSQKLTELNNTTKISIIL